MKNVWCCQLAERKAIGRLVVIKEGSMPGIVVRYPIGIYFDGPSGDEHGCGRTEIINHTSPVSIDDNQIPPGFVELHLIHFIHAVRKDT